MNHHRIRTTAIILAVALAACFGMAAYAAPYSTYIRDRDDNFRFSPPLYLPSHLLNYDLNGINDIFIDGEDFLYAARTGSDVSEVVIFDAQERFVASIGDDVLESASGVHVSRSFGDPHIYVADNRQAKVFVFDKEGNLLQTIARPTSPLFGTHTPFTPLKVAVDMAGGIYIVGEGATGGIIKLGSDGEFVGYFGANVSRANWLRSLQRLLFSEEMMGQFIRNVPVSMSNLSIDGRGIIYATTKGDTSEPLRKLNIAGINLFAGSAMVFSSFDAQLESVTTDGHGNVYVLDGQTGSIVILDASGDTVCIFGERSTTVTPIGVTFNPVSIAINSRQQIYIADQGDGTIVSFAPTPLMDTLFTALALYREGYFLEGEVYWQDILARNSSVAMAYDALGMGQMKRENYREAMGLFRTANNRALYSDAFWEYRQAFMQDIARYIIIGLLAAVFISFIVRVLDKRTRFLDGWRAFGRHLRTRPAIVESLLVVGILRRPADLFYDLRVHDKVTYRATAILYAGALAVLIAGDYLTGFIFNEINTAAWWYNPLQRLGNLCLLALLFIAANFLVTSLRDGQGNFMQIVKGTALCLVPLVLFYPPYIVLSNIFSAQEVFILDAVRFLIFAWCAVLLLVMISYLHDYGFRETLSCVFLTLFAMMVLFVAAILVYTLGKEAVSFFSSLIEEAWLRVAI